MSISSDNNFEIRQREQSVSRGTDDSTHVSRPRRGYRSIFVDLKKDELDAKHHDYQKLLERFEQIDKNNNNVIERDEFEEYDSRTSRRERAGKQLETNLHSARSQQRDEDILSDTLVRLDIEHSDLMQILKAYNNEEKKDLDTLLKETLGEEEYNKIANLSDDEKVEALKTKLEEKYKADYSQEEIENLPDDDIYKQHYNRIKRGELTEGEKALGLTSEEIANATPEKLQELAKRAVELERLKETSMILVSADDSAVHGLHDLINESPSKVRSGLALVSIMTAQDDMKKQNAERILEEIETGRLQLDSDDNEILDEVLGAILNENAGDKRVVKSITGIHNKLSATVQMRMFKGSMHAHRGKLERGEITQEEYDATYVETYAASAHKMKSASEAYNYIQTNATDSNRNDTMNMLASTAYQIEDEEQRSAVVKELLNSPYATPEVKENLEKSYRQFLVDMVKETTSGNVGVGSSGLREIESYVAQNQVVPNNNNENVVYYEIPPEVYYTTGATREESQQVSENILAIINSGDKYAKIALYSKPIEITNTTVKEQQMQLSQAVLMLDEAIKSGDFDKSEYKPAILKKIESLDTHTFVNGILLKLSPKAQNYLIKEGVIDVKTLDIVINLEQDLEKLPQDIQDEIKERRKSREEGFGNPFDYENWSKSYLT